MGAAPRRLRTTAVVVAVIAIASLGVTSSASANRTAKRHSATSQAQLPSHIWAVDVTSAPLPQQLFLMTQAAAGGANTLIIKDGYLPPWILQSLRIQADRLKLQILSPFAPRFVPGHSLAKSTQLLCARQRSKDKAPCAVIAKDALHARLLAAAPGIDVVLLYARNADAMRTILKTRLRNRIVVVAPGSSSTTSAWRAHVTVARSRPSTGLGVSISGKGSALTQFLSALPVKSVASATPPVPAPAPATSGGASTSTPAGPAT